MDRDREEVAPSLEIFVDNSRIPPEAEADLYRVEISEDVRSIGMFSFFLNAGNPKTGDIRWIDDKVFPVGSEIKIKGGFHAPLVELMVGEITAIEPEYPARGPMHLTIRGYDRLHRLGHGRKSRSFRDMKDSDIAGQIAHDWNLTPEADDTGVSHEYVFQNNQTDMDFLRSRARRIGFEIQVLDKTLFFRKPPQSGGKIVTLNYGENLHEFSARLSIHSQPSKVSVQGWDSREKKDLKGEATEGDQRSLMAGDESGAVLTETVVGEAIRIAVLDPPASLEDAEAMARGQFNDHAFDFVIGDGTAVGNPDIRAGVVIEILGLGGRFSGLYYVLSSTHTISTVKGYTVDFTVERSAI